MTSQRKVIAAAILAALIATAETRTAHAVESRTPAQTWAFCGVHPDDPFAQRKAYALAAYAGIDATFGPCMAPDWSTYTAAYPGKRYVDPETYLRVLKINARAGMRTVVYDARVWSDNAAERVRAINFWMPYRTSIAAFDLGDEFDPTTDQWAIMHHRWNVVLSYVTPILHVRPYTNHLGWSDVMDEAIRDLGPDTLSFDNYDPAQVVPLARTYGKKVTNLMCGIDAMPFADHKPQGYAGTTTLMRDLRNAGCDSFLVFGGVHPYRDNANQSDAYFGDSLVTDTGTAKVLSIAIHDGAK